MREHQWETDLSDDGEAPITVVANINPGCPPSGMHLAPEYSSPGEGPTVESMEVLDEMGRDIYGSLSRLTIEFLEEGVIKDWRDKEEEGPDEPEYDPVDAYEKKLRLDGLE
jgi:hypothetical protein